MLDPALHVCCIVQHCSCETLVGGVTKIWRWWLASDEPRDPATLPTASASSRTHKKENFALAAMAVLTSAVGVLLLLTFSLGFASAAEKKGLALELVDYSISLGSDDTPKLQVVATSHDGSPASSATVTLVSAHSVATGSPVSISEQESFTSLGDGKYELALQSSEELSLGKYKVKIDADNGKGQLTTVVAVTAPISVSNAKYSILESDGDGESSESNTALHKTVSLPPVSHTQKLKLSFKLKTPSGAPFKAQQVLLKLKHVESGEEEAYLVKPSTTTGGYEHTLEFSNMPEKLKKHRSGGYYVELLVGDDVMENSFLWNVASLELDLPEGSSEETKVEAAPVSRFAPKAEIVHLFRQPEKRPPAYISMTFLVLTLLPLVGFFLAYQRLGVNLKALPSGGLPLAAAGGFHGGIALILGLYFLFWLKLNLFTTLKWLGFLGLFTLVPGFQILSYLANHSVKAKSA